jgi:hypothetical protein
MLRLLLDEDVPHDILTGLRRRNPVFPLADVREMGMGSTPDATILAWAAEHQWIVVTRDRNTLIADAYTRIRSGDPVFGVLVVPQRPSIGEMIDNLEYIGAVGLPVDFDNPVRYLPIIGS